MRGMEKLSTSSTGEMIGIISGVYNLIFAIATGVNYIVNDVLSLWYQ